MSNTYNALIHAKQDGTGEEVANNKTGGDGSLYAPVTSIATPENGDTASKAYAVGEMFIRGGKLCTCIVAISSGDALVKDTNYKEGDVGSELTELNSKQFELLYRGDVANGGSFPIPTNNHSLYCAIVRGASATFVKGTRGVIYGGLPNNSNAWIKASIDTGTSPATLNYERGPGWVGDNESIVVYGVN